MNNTGYYELQLYSSPKSLKVFFLSFEAKTLTVFVLLDEVLCNFLIILIENFSYSAKRISDCHISYQPPSLRPFQSQNWFKSNPMKNQNVLF